MLELKAEGTQSLRPLVLICTPPLMIGRWPWLAVHVVQESAVFRCNVEFSRYVPPLSRMSMLALPCR